MMTTGMSAPPIDAVLHRQTTKRQGEGGRAPSAQPLKRASGLPACLPAYM